MVAANVGGGSGHRRQQGRRSEQPGLARGSEWLGMLVTATQVAQGCGCKGSLKVGEGKIKYVKSQTPPSPHFIIPQGQPKGLFPQISLL